MLLLLFGPLRLMPSSLSVTLGVFQAWLTEDAKKFITLALCKVRGLRCCVVYDARSRYWLPTALASATVPIRLAHVLGLVSQSALLPDISWCQNVFVCGFAPALLPY